MCISAHAEIEKRQLSTEKWGYSVECGVRRPFDSWISEVAANILET